MNHAQNDGKIKINGQLLKSIKEDALASQRTPKGDANSYKSINQVCGDKIVCLQVPLHIQQNPFFRQKKQGFSIPSGRINLKTIERPDPWTYMPEDRNVKPRSPFATIGRQTRRERLTEGPSPAQYNTNYNVLFHSIRRPVFGKEKRIDRQKKQGPGPGNYDVQNADAYRTYHRFVKIGKEKREHIDKGRDLLPAPNKYTQQSQFDKDLKMKKGYSIGLRIKCKTEADFPLDYFKQQIQNIHSKNDKEVVMRRNPAFSFKRSIRRQSDEQKSPGPAAYFPEEHLKKGPIIGKSMRKLHSIPNFPGPEAYMVPIHQKEGPSFSIPKAIPKNYSQRTPGPGQYSPQLPQSEKYRSISLGIADRGSPLQREKTPGPGDYNLGILFGQKKSTEKESRHKSKSPGSADNIRRAYLTKKHKSNRQL